MVKVLENFKILSKNLQKSVNNVNYRKSFLIQFCEFVPNIS